jgi:hypothetical protein
MNTSREKEFNDEGRMMNDEAKHFESAGAPRFQRFASSFIIHHSYFL